MVAFHRQKRTATVTKCFLFASRLKLSKKSKLDFNSLAFALKKELLVKDVDNAICNQDSLLTEHDWAALMLLLTHFSWSFDAGACAGQDTPAKDSSPKVN